MYTTQPSLAYPNKNQDQNEGNSSFSSKRTKTQTHIQQFTQA